MTDLIKVNFDSDRPTVSGRDLHAALEIKTAYKEGCAIMGSQRGRTLAHL